MSHTTRCQRSGPAGPITRERGSPLWLSCRTGERRETKINPLSKETEACVFQESMRAIPSNATGMRDTHLFAFDAASDAEAMQYVGAVAFHSCAWDSYD